MTRLNDADGTVVFNDGALVILFASICNILLQRLDRAGGLRATFRHMDCVRRRDGVAFGAVGALGRLLERRAFAPDSVRLWTVGGLSTWLLRCTDGKLEVIRSTNEVHGE